MTHLINCFVALMVIALLIWAIRGLYWEVRDYLFRRNVYNLIKDIEALPSITDAKKEDLINRLSYISEHIHDFGGNTPEEWKKFNNDGQALFNEIRRLIKEQKNH